MHLNRICECGIIGYMPKWTGKEHRQKRTADNTYICFTCCPCDVSCSTSVTFSCYVMFVCSSHECYVFIPQAQEVPQLGETFAADFEHRLEQTFNQLAAEGNGWQNAFTTDRGNVRIRAMSDSTLRVEYSYSINLPTEGAVRLFRPEVLCAGKHPLLTSCCRACTILQTFAPGDVICSMQPKRIWSLFMPTPPKS